ncbi:hypothetical protein ACHHYP_02588 [Achlya hypogyna]|uniref:Transmembrane protein n=1 Tax=Achlya hypogyna TaxID=1202772 RepID=A0A1V9Z622_ACHHY|nr:hypothetical protein ACHHYP_02588 [Achlya hypogyna]
MRGTLPPFAAHGLYHFCFSIMLVFWLIMAVLWTSLFDVLPSWFYARFPIDTVDADKETAFSEQHRLACERRQTTASVFYYFVPLLACALLFEYVKLHAVLHSMLLVFTALLALMFLRYVVAGRILEHQQEQWISWGLANPAPASSTSKLLQSAPSETTPLVLTEPPLSSDEALTATGGEVASYGSVSIAIASEPHENK